MVQFNFENNSLKSGIYCVFNNLNWRIYIGSTKNFENRWNSHYKSLLKGNHYNNFLQRDFNKCLKETGNDNFFEFHIIEIMENSSFLERTTKEQFYVHLHYDNRKQCYNFRKNTISNEQSCFSKTPEETRALLSKFFTKMWKNPEFIKRQSIGRKKAWEEPERKRKHYEMLEKRAQDPVYMEKHFNSLLPYRTQQIQTLNEYRDTAVENSVAARIKYYGKVIDPNGDVHEILNLEKFTREHNLKRRAFTSIILGLAPSYKGWRKYEKNLVGVKYINRITEEHFAAKKFKLLSPDGEIYEGTNITKFCQEHELCKENITAVLNGRRKSHKGWRDADDPRYEKKKSDFKWGHGNHPRIVEFFLKTPEGNVIKASNIRFFCLTQNLNPGCIGMVLRNERKSHKGWTKPTEQEIYNFVK